MYPICSRSRRRNRRGSTPRTRTSPLVGASAGQHPDRRRLARARWADDPEDRSAWDREVDPIDDAAVVERPGDTAHDDEEVLVGEGRLGHLHVGRQIPARC